MLLCVMDSTDMLVGHAAHTTNVVCTQWMGIATMLLYEMDMMQQQTYN
jgi:hypothetical protein